MIKFQNIVILILGIVLIAGCSAPSKFVCPDGSTASSQSQCIKCGDGVCTLGPEDKCSCPSDCTQDKYISSCPAERPFFDNKIGCCVSN